MEISSINDTYISVPDYENHRIQKFTTGGDFVSEWGTKGTGDGQFNSDSEGNVYVNDMNNHRIQKIISDGQFVTSWFMYDIIFFSAASGSLFARSTNESGSIEILFKNAIKRRSYESRVAAFLIAPLNKATDSPHERDLSTGLRVK